MARRPSPTGGLERGTLVTRGARRARRSPAGSHSNAPTRHQLRGAATPPTRLATTTLGRTGLEITRIGLGAWAIGGGGWEYGRGPQDDDASIAAIHQALDSGVSWIDTAAGYGFGRSEAVVGRALKELPPGRRPLRFTKCSLLEGEGGRVVRSLERDSILREAEASLRRLGVDAIDLYQIPWPIPEADIEEGWSALCELKAQGMVRHIGVSNSSVAQLERVCDIAPVETLQPPYSLIARDAEVELLPYAQREGIGVIVYSPTGSGLLTGAMTGQRVAELPDDDWRKTDPDFTEPRLSGHLALVERLEAVAERHGTTPGAVAVAWTLRNPAVNGAIVGFRRPDQVAPILPAHALELTDADLATIAGHDQTLGRPAQCRAAGTTARVNLSSTGKDSGARSPSDNVMTMITAFLGKGGVGKTSIASAFALSCARIGRTALVSSDFMPSLGHIFTRSYDDLTVIELTAKEVSQLWAARYGDQAKTLLNEVVEAEDWMVTHIAESPGVAEEFMISNIVDLDASGEFEFVVWDTAASSSTMHLLLLQKEFYGHLDRDVKIYLRLKDRLRHAGALDILEEWKALANRVWDALELTRFYLVTTLDDLSMIQADEIEDDIDSLGLSISGRIYNRCRPHRPQGNAGVASIPELEGSALDVVHKMEAHLSGLLPSAGPA